METVYIVALFGDWCRLHAKEQDAIGEQPELIMKGFHTFLLSVNYVRKERIMWHLLDVAECA